MDEQILDDQINHDEFNFDERVNKLVTEGYSFRIGDYISMGNRILMKNLGAFIGYLLIYFLILLVSRVIPRIGTIASSVLAPAMTAGFFMVANKLFHDKDFEFGNFFDGFKHIRHLFLNKITQSIVYIGLLLGYAYLVMPHDLKNVIDAYQNILSGHQLTEEEAEAFLQLMKTFMIGMIPPFLVVTFLSMMMMFAPFIIVFERRNFWEAITTSFRILLPKTFHILGFILLLFLINMAGALCILVGLLYTLPLTFCIMYSCYELVVGTDPKANDQFQTP